MDPSEPVIKFKLVIIGDYGVGKTALATRHNIGQFQKPYDSPAGSYASRPIDFSTNRGKIRFVIWDTAGQEKFGHLRDDYYAGADCAIIMFDLTSRETYKNVAKWHSDLTKICDNIPIVLVGNKADDKDRRVKAREIIFHRKRNLQYYDVSTRGSYQCEKPFLWLLKKLTAEPNLYLLESPFIVPPDVLMIEDHIKQLQIERQKADEFEEPDFPDPEDDFCKDKLK